MLQNDTELNMVRGGLTVTLRCNLKCKLCAARSPYYKNPPELDFEHASRIIDRYFEVVTHVEKFVITGGEPFLHRQLPQIIKHLAHYENQFDVLNIFTNGSILPPAEIQTACLSSNKIHVIIDNYGPDLSSKIKEISDLFTTAGVAHTTRGYYGENLHCDGWVDLSDLSKRLDTQEEIEKLFAKCIYPQVLKFCFTMFDSEMHPCAVSRRCMTEKVIPKNPDEYVDLFDDTLSIQEKRARLKKLQNCKSLAACAYCAGFCNDSPRYKPAEQLRL